MWEQTIMDTEHRLPALLAQDLDHYFGELALSYQDRLYAFALSLTGSVQDAEDIVQEALLGAYITLVNYPAERTRLLKLRSWLYKLTLNVVRNHLRRRQLLTIPLEFSEESLDLPNPDGDDPERFFESTESQQEMAKLVHTHFWSNLQPIYHYSGHRRTPLNIRELKRIHEQSHRMHQWWQTSPWMVALPNF
jgi:RNA polymerase sigma factor (sigma-70 family)